MIPFFRNVSTFDFEVNWPSEIRQSAVTTSSDPITDDTEAADGQTTLLILLYPVRRMDRFDIKRDWSDVMQLAVLVQKFRGRATRIKTLNQFYHRIDDWATEHKWENRRLICTCDLILLDIHHEESCNHLDLWSPWESLNTFDCNLDMKQWLNTDW